MFLYSYNTRDWRQFYTLTTIKHADMMLGTQANQASQPVSQSGTSRRHIMLRMLNSFVPMTCAQSVGKKVKKHKEIIGYYHISEGEGPVSMKSYLGVTQKDEVFSFKKLSPGWIWFETHFVCIKVGITKNWGKPKVEKSKMQVFQQECRVKNYTISKM